MGPPKAGRLLLGAGHLQRIRQPFDQALILRHGGFQDLGFRV